MNGRQSKGAVISIAVSLGLAAWIVVQALAVPAKNTEPDKDTSSPKQAVELSKPEKSSAKAPVLTLPPPPAPAPKPQPAKMVETPAPATAPKAIAKPEPKPQPVAQPIAKSAPKPAISKVAPQLPSEPQPEPVKTVTVTTRQELTQGRALLRILEHGKGPSVEIAWPDERNAEKQLFETFSQCYGMQGALMDNESRLFTAEGPRGQAWDINLDRYSGFLRQPSGHMSTEERNRFRAIRRHHNLAPGTTAVRIFPRQVDAALLGGLQKLIGSRYSEALSIRARYRFDGRKVTVENLIVDGNSISGIVSLAHSRSACGRRA